MSLRERGPDPDFDERDELLRHMCGAFERIAAQPRYREGGRYEKLILGGVITLLVAGVANAIAVYGGFSNLQGRFEEWQKNVNQQLQAQSQRIDRLENRKP